MRVEHEGVADYLRCRSYGPLRVFFRASCSWRSEGPFGQSFSVTPPLQALRGLPCLGSFSVAQRIRHIGGPPGWGPTLGFSASGVGWASLSIVQRLMLACGGREATVMAPPPTCDSAVSPGFHGCPAFLQGHFPPQCPPSHPLDQSLHSQQQPSPWDCFTVPQLQLLAAAPSTRSVSRLGYVLSDFLSI